MPLPAGCPGTAVPGICGQQLPPRAAAELQHPSPDRGPGSLQPPAAAQRAGASAASRAISAALSWANASKSPLSPSAVEGASEPATGLA
jgi:hypothetical protein